ncbi:MAG: hypothetical protein ACPGSA_04270, partial [Poseidonia sp.]
MARALAFGSSEAPIGGATALWASPSAWTIASTALRASLSSVTTVLSSAISEPSVTTVSSTAIS